MQIRGKQLIVTSCIFIWTLLFTPVQTFAEEANLDVQAKAYFIMDVKSGAILAEKNADQPLPPASMTKMMTQLLVLDQIKQGKLTWDELVKVSPRASAINEAEIQLQSNDQMTVKELFIASVVQSANDATVVLAERIGGTETQFVELMNQKAKEIGMKNTHYRNATGLNMSDYPDPPQVEGDHVMAAHDSAILADYLIENYPDILTYTSISNYTFRSGTPRQIEVKNWNWMLPNRKAPYPGVDGMKTGHTNAAGYCFTGTAQKDEFRLVTVVMGTASEPKRFSETAKLLDFGFNNFEYRVLAKQNQAIPGFEKLALPNGVEEKVGVQTKEMIQLPLRKGEEQKYQYKVQFQPNIKAPLQAGQTVGTVEITYNGQPMKGIQPIDLVTSQSVEEGSWIRLFFRGIGNEISSWF